MIVLNFLAYILIALFWHSKKFVCLNIYFLKFLISNIIFSQGTIPEKEKKIFYSPFCSRIQNWKSTSNPQSVSSAFSYLQKYKSKRGKCESQKFSETITFLSPLYAFSTKFTPTIVDGKGKKKSYLLSLSTYPPTQCLSSLHRFGILWRKKNVSE